MSIEIEQATADEIPASWLSVLQRYGRGTTRSSPLDGKKFILAGSIRLIFTTSGPTT